MEKTYFCNEDILLVATIKLPLRLKIFEVFSVLLAAAIFSAAASCSSRCETSVSIILETVFPRKLTIYQNNQLEWKLKRYIFWRSDFIPKWSV